MNSIISKIYVGIYLCSSKKKIFATAFANISQVLEGIPLLILLFFDDYSQETQGA